MKTNILMIAVLSSVVATVGAAQEQDRHERPDFATLDSNGDGALTMDELQAQSTARFAQRDTNGDGALSVEELTAAAVEKAGERAARMLERMDANEDGVLQQAELNPRGGDRFERMFERADADEDGAISAEEFEAAKERRGGRRGEGRRGGRGHGRHGRG